MVYRDWNCFDVVGMVDITKLNNRLETKSITIVYVHTAKPLLQPVGQAGHIDEKGRVYWR
jgi:hypothetical protein